jgi:hypothetical protein
MEGIAVSVVSDRRYVSSGDGLGEERDEDPARPLCAGLLQKPVRYLLGNGIERVGLVQVLGRSRQHGRPRKSATAQ